ncbi:hypothetical protein GCM10023189_10920 [Nibrella saemangeumensis]|uniref:Uncharacterized protein n=1 Tax=Nibrella saemangeumensis TaxID=1084526 RepID=A0ABP8MKC6_9BACT
MKLFLNQFDIPFQVDDSVFINQPLTYWTDNNAKVVPHFSGVIKSIEVIINPKSRFIRKKGEQNTLVVDMVRYEILPHSQFNPFGQVEIFDQVESGSKLFATEQALLNDSATNPSVYHAKGEALNITTSL